MSIKNNLRGMIIKCLPENIPEDKINFKVLEDSGYSSDAAIVLSSILKKDTLSLAKRIKNAIDNEIFSEIVISDDGMLTFYFKKDYLISSLKKVIHDGKNYGKSNYGKKKKICLECVIERLDNESTKRIIYLDSLANIMTYSGYDVTSICYVKDDKDIKSKLEDIRVYFDSFVSRNSLNNIGIVDDVLSSLQRTDYCFIKDDGLWIRMNDYEDKALTNSDGDYTDFLYVISYYINLFNSGYDGIIDICFKDDDINFIKRILEVNNYDLNKLDIKKVNNDYIIDDVLINEIRYKVVSGSDKISAIEKTNSIISNFLRGKRNNSFESDSTKRDEYAYIIMNKLLEFEDIITWCATRGVINRLCNYLEDLVCLFNDYSSALGKYNEEDNLITEAAYIVINNIASMLGLILREDL